MLRCSRAGAGLELFFQSGRLDELRAAEQVIAFVKQKYKGLTHSALRPAFEGFWWDPKRKRWVQDKISVLILDVSVSIQSSTLDYEIQALQLVIADEYRKKQCPQKEVWVFCHQILIRVESIKSPASP